MRLLITNPHGDAAPAAASAAGQYRVHSEFSSEFGNVVVGFKNNY